MDLPLVPLILALGYAIFLFILSYYTVKWKKHEKGIVNVTAGLLFSYIFLTQLPEIYMQNIPDAQKVMSAFFMFIGFIGFYLAEKRVFMENHHEKLHEKLLTIRTGSFYIVHFITGYLIIFTFAETAVLGVILLLIPFTCHIVATSIMFEDLNRWMKGSIESRVLFPLLVFVGAVAALITQSLLQIPLVHFYSFFTGTLFYLATTLFTPQHKKASLTYFLCGILLYFVLLMFN